MCVVGVFCIRAFWRFQPGLLHDFGSHVFAQLVIVPESFQDCSQNLKVTMTAWGRATHDQSLVWMTDKLNYTKSNGVLLQRAAWETARESYSIIARLCKCLSLELSRIRLVWEVHCCFCQTVTNSVMAMKKHLTLNGLFCNLFLMLIFIYFVSFFTWVNVTGFLEWGEGCFYCLDCVKNYLSSEIKRKQTAVCLIIFQIKRESNLDLMWI